MYCWGPLSMGSYEVRLVQKKYYVKNFCTFFREIGVFGPHLGDFRDIHIHLRAECAP